VEEFRFLLPASELSFIEKAEEQPLTIEVNEATFEVAIYTETENVSSISENPDDFALIPNYCQHELIYTGQDFLDELKACLKYTDKQKFGNIRYQGVLLESNSDSITLCATDAHVLRVTKLTAAPALEKRFLMNSNFCKLISSLKYRGDLLISLMTNERTTYTVLDFEINSMKVTFNLIIKT